MNGTTSIVKLYQMNKTTVGHSQMNLTIVVLGQINEIIAGLILKQSDHCESL